VNKYDEEEGELYSEVTDYNFSLDKVTDSKKASFYFSGIEKIKFRALDTNGFLHAVNLKPQQLSEPVVKENQRKEPVPSGYVVIKTTLRTQGIICSYSIFHQNTRLLF
jgi:hypothetical protein